MFVVPGVSSSEDRELDLVVGRLPIYGGKTVIENVVLPSPLSSQGASKHGAEKNAGSTFHGARLNKANAYPELQGDHPHFHVLLLGCEVGGHSSEECHGPIKQLVTFKGFLYPMHLRPFLQNMYKRKWYGVLSCAIQKAVAWNITGTDELQFEPLHPAPEFEEMCATWVDAPRVCRMSR